MSLKDSNESFDVIILEADGKIDSENGYGHLLQKRLAEFNITSKKYYLPEISSNLDELPKKPTIISGGMTEVTKDIKWINQSKDFIRKVIITNRKGDRLPLLGICFGAQLIAESFVKGSVTYLDDPEMGNTAVNLKEKHQLFEGFPEKFSGYTFHYNQIQLEKEFKIIAANEHMEHKFAQAFEIPNAQCYGLQFHPEFTYTEFMVLLEIYQQLIGNLGLNYSTITSQVKEIPANGKILANFARII